MPHAEDTTVSYDASIGEQPAPTVIYPGDAANAWTWNQRLVPLEGIAPHVPASGGSIYNSVQSDMGQIERDAAPTFQDIATPIAAENNTAGRQGEMGALLLPMSQYTNSIGPPSFHPYPPLPYPPPHSYPFSGMYPAHPPPPPVPPHSYWPDVSSSSNASGLSLKPDPNDFDPTAGSWPLEGGLVRTPKASRASTSKPYARPRPARRTPAKEDGFLFFRGSCYKLTICNADEE